MFTLNLFGLAFLFIVQLGLLVSLNMRSDWHWTIKSIAILTTLVVWIVGYNTITSYSGSSGPETQLPSEFQFLWSHEQQPSGDDPGQIYVWAIPKGDTGPKGYRVAYTRDLHVKLLKEKEKICNGKKRYAEIKMRAGQKSIPSNHQGFRFKNPVELLPPKN